MSLQLMLTFEESHARNVLVMGSGPVVFLRVGGASFIFGPGVFGLILRVPLGAELYGGGLHLAAQQDKLCGALPGALAYLQRAGTRFMWRHPFLEDEPDGGGL